MAVCTYGLELNPFHSFKILKTSLSNNTTQKVEKINEIKEFSKLRTLFTFSS